MVWEKEKGSGILPKPLVPSRKKQSVGKSKISKAYSRKDLHKLWEEVSNKVNTPRTLLNALCCFEA